MKLRSLSERLKNGEKFLLTLEERNKGLSSLLLFANITPNMTLSCKRCGAKAKEVGSKEKISIGEG